MKHISEISPKISAPTGQPAPAETKLTPIGRELGKPGSDENAPAIIDLPSTLPAEIDLAMDHLLPPSVATSFEPKYYAGDDPGWFGAVVDYEFSGADRDDVQAALEMLGKWMIPAGHNEVIRELAMLRALVTARKEDAESLSVILAAFAEQIEIAGYPVDVVRQARIDSAKVCKFWPSWSEFMEHCDGHFLKRRAYYLALRRYWSNV